LQFIVVDLLVGGTVASVVFKFGFCDVDEMCCSLVVLRSSCSSSSFAIDLSAAAARTSAVKPTKTSSKIKWPHHRLY
jgi:hypothetical protein